jgi:hypothetical protein
MISGMQTSSDKNAASDAGHIAEQHLLPLSATAFRRLERLPRAVAADPTSPRH